MKVTWAKRLSRRIRGHVRRSTLGTHGFAVIADTWNGPLAVDPGDFTISQQLLREGEYSSAEIQFLAGRLAPESTLIFAGAHIGSVLIPLTHLSMATRVLAYEPSPKNLRLLKLNLLLNGMEHLVEVCPWALGAQYGALKFTENPINSGNSRIDIERGEQSVAVAPLDECLPFALTSKPIHLMVMDVEGFEVEALRGARATLARTKTLFIEFAPEQLEEQGATVEEFAALVGSHFSSGYAFGREGVAHIPQDVAGWLIQYPRRHGLLLNLLLTNAPTLSV